MAYRYYSFMAYRAIIPLLIASIPLASITILQWGTIGFKFGQERPGRDGAS
jgi:hypothetical protein